MLHRLLALLSALHLALAPFATRAAELRPQPATSALLADTQTLIGDQGLAEGSLPHNLLHGLAGCAFNEASGADCVAGFAAGVVGSLYAGYLHENGIGADDPAIGEHLNTAELLGAFAGFVFSSGLGENVSLGGQVSQSGVENNYLTHAQYAAFAEEMQACAIDDTECQIKVAEKYKAISDEQNAELIEAIKNGDWEKLLEVLRSTDGMAALREDLLTNWTSSEFAADLFEDVYQGGIIVEYQGSASTFDALAMYGLGTAVLNGDINPLLAMRVVADTYGKSSLDNQALGLLDIFSAAALMRLGSILTPDFRLGKGQMVNSSSRDPMAKSTVRLMIYRMVQLYRISLCKGVDRGTKRHRSA